MSIKQAMWVHGTAVQAEREGYHVNRRRPGWGARFAGHGKDWFHFAVPTPVIFGGKNSDLNKAFVLYRTTMSARIVAVHLYDGRTQFKTLDNLNLSGAHDTALDDDNTFLVSPVHVKWGLGISVLVDFGDSTPQGVPQIEFASAGADFVIPD